MLGVIRKLYEESAYADSINEFGIASQLESEADQYLEAAGDVVYSLDDFHKRFGYGPLHWAEAEDFGVIGSDLTGWYLYEIECRSLIDGPYWDYYQAVDMLRILEGHGD